MWLGDSVIVVDYNVGTEKEKRVRKKYLTSFRCTYIRLLLYTVLPKISKSYSIHIYVLLWTILLFCINIMYIIIIINMTLLCCILFLKDMPAIFNSTGTRSTNTVCVFNIIVFFFHVACDLVFNETRYF